VKWSLANKAAVHKKLKDFFLKNIIKNKIYMKYFLSGGENF